MLEISAILQPGPIRNHPLSDSIRWENYPKSLAI
jgi:hypothetical protein